MRVTKDLYDAAVAEVRGQATDEQVAVLESDIPIWAETLRTVLDEVDGQVRLRSEKCEADATLFPRDESSIRRDFASWHSKSNVFRKHVWVRLRHVERLEDCTLPPNVRRLIEQLRLSDDDEDEDLFEETLEVLYGLIE